MYIYLYVSSFVYNMHIRYGTVRPVGHMAMPEDRLRGLVAASWAVVCLWHVTVHAKRAGKLQTQQLGKRLAYAEFADEKTRHMSRFNVYVGLQQGL